MVDDLPLGDVAPGQVFVIRNHESRYLTHTFHKYAGKFIPQIPRWAMRRHLERNEGRLVLDPFVGSGTTLVECLLDGQRGVGIDVDPLARLICKVKTTLLPQQELARLPETIEARLRAVKRGTHKPQIATIAHWFNDKAIRDLSAIRAVVEEYRDKPDLFDFLLICFSAVVRRASNADNQTMKTYVSHTHHKTPEPAKPLFLNTVRDYATRMVKLGELVSEKGSATVLDNADARSLPKVWSAANLPKVDLAITSPPYIKSVDYIYNQMAELFWIGETWDLETQSKQNQFKLRYIGTDRPNSAPVPPVDRLPGSVRKYVKEVAETSPFLADVMIRYFGDMLAHFDGMRKILRSHAHYVLVVGDSTLAGVAVPTHELLSDCAVVAGFSAQQTFAYEIRNKHMRFPRAGRGGEVHHDWVIDLTTTSKATNGRERRGRSEGGRRQPS
ncbi:MAG: DNA methyltransferase [Gemmatimonadetes bacterium]|nr:DNA methyltransferase [Gemmatimonadota bacterium]